MPRLADALREPIPLVANRVPRFYRGGRLLDTFRREPDPHDDQRPEDWVGSATRTWTAPGRPISTLGPSPVDVDGRRTTLDEVLAQYPEELAGPALTERAGPTLGVLVKLLDAAERLPVHCHPTRELAAALLGSRFGKTEAWLILGTREPQERVWAGFRETVERDRLRYWIERHDSEALLGALVEYTVGVDDVLLIPGGVPHAIGAGVFLLELQEPTDFSVVAETRGFPIDPADAALNLGWERAIDFFDTAAAADLRQQPEGISDTTTRLLGRPADPFFRALRMRIEREAVPPFEAVYAVAVVVAGRGSISGRARRLALSRGTTFALSATAVPDARIVAEEELDVVWCLGADPAALEREPLPSPRGVP